MNGKHPNLLPYKCFIEEGGHSFGVAEHYPYSLATVLKYNRHLIECEDGNDIIKQYIAYQLVQALAFLHQHNITYPSLSPTAVILTEYLWVFLPLPSLSPPTFNSSLEYITTSWVSGHISNYDYIMYLNEAAGRSMDDSNFHSIMPWVCDFTSPTGGWRDFSVSKFRMNKGDSQLDVTYQHSVPKHHISESLSELTYAIYMARCMPVTLLRSVVRSNFQAKEYPSKQSFA